MTEQKFTAIKIIIALREAAKKQDFEDTVDFEKVFLAALAEPRWLPANKQVYKNPNGKYYRQEEGYKCDPKSRPLTLSEVGKEPVQHLVNCIKRLASDAEFAVADILHDSRNIGWDRAQMLARERFAQECITTHWELMK